MIHYEHMRDAWDEAAANAQLAEAKAARERAAARAHLAAVRAAYADAKAHNDRRAMQYEANIEMWWFARFNEDGSKRQ